jgi:hypothetical protein
MEIIKRWIIRLVADDIRRGGDVAKALNETAAPLSVHIHGEIIADAAFDNCVMAAVSKATRRQQLG